MVERIKLVKPNVIQDELGQIIEGEPTYTELFADVSGITRSEFAAAGQIGLSPDAKFTVWAGEYSGEEIVEYNGDRYIVYRTFPINGRIELYTGRRIGESHYTTVG